MIYLWAQPEVTQNISAGLGGTPAQVQRTHPPGRATSMAFYTGSQGIASAVCRRCRLQSSRPPSRGAFLGTPHPIFSY